VEPEQDSVFLTSVSLSLNELSWWCLHSAAHGRQVVLAFMENCSTGSHLTWHTNWPPSLNQDASQALNLALHIEQWSVSWNVCGYPRNVMLA